MHREDTESRHRLDVGDAVDAGEPSPAARIAGGKRAADARSLEAAPLWDQAGGLIQGQTHFWRWIPLRALKNESGLTG